MVGVKGAGGPPPKRSDQRRRTNPPAHKVTKAADTPVVVPPDADPEWHYIATLMFESLKNSGQSQFYSNSDWGIAYAIAESMSREFSLDGPPSGAAQMAWLKGLSLLLATEGDRRRVGIELQRPKPVDDGGVGVSWIDDARRRLNGTG